MVSKTLPPHHIVLHYLSIESSEMLHPQKYVAVVYYILEEGFTEEGVVVMLGEVILVILKDIALKVGFGDWLHYLCKELVGAAIHVLYVRKFHSVDYF